MILHHYGNLRLHSYTSIALQKFTKRFFSCGYDYEMSMKVLDDDENRKIHIHQGYKTQKLFKGGTRCRRKIEGDLDNADYKCFYMHLGRV